MDDDEKPAATTPPIDEKTSRLGRFIQKYHTFLSSTMLGIAGLAATSIWQYRQSETTRKQAESQQKVAETAAENSWKIERADILSKNLSVLASTGPSTVEQRYGVLLSLTRGNILDPELAVSYALELGRDSADDMVSVLANAKEKDYGRLARAFVLSCDEKYGMSPNIDVCNDKLASRSDAIAQLFADDVDTSLAGDQGGPMLLLKDERQVQQSIQQLTGLFENGLNDMYEHRQWDEIAKFNAFSPGAHLVGSLALSAVRTGEFVTDDEQKVLDAFHTMQTLWLTTYLSGKSCDSECKAHIVDVIVSHFSESAGDYDAAMRALLLSGHTQAGGAIARLHARLMWCQVSDEDLVPLRDRVLVPALVQVLKSATPDPATKQSLLNLLSLVPEPAASDTDATTAWTAMLALVDKAGGNAGKTYRDRRAVAERQRKQPPPAVRKLNFCALAAAPSDDGLPSITSTP